MEELKEDGFVVTLTINQLELIITRAIQKAFEDYTQELKKDESDNELIPRTKVAEMFQVSLVTLDKWRRQGVLPKPIKMKSRVYYRKDEIIETMKRSGR